MKHTIQVMCISAVVTILTITLAKAVTTDETFKAVCDGGFVLSDKATVACAKGIAPKAMKDGTRFSNRSAVGAEFNTLARQIK